MIASNKSRITITLNDDLLDLIDSQCEKLHINRSEYISIVCSSTTIEVFQNFPLINENITKND